MSTIFHRTPITYYGGKQQLVPTILPLIPEHSLYCEPFSGGAAIFFAKAPSQIEVVNDTNKELINFFRVLQMDFASLACEIRVTLYSRAMFNDAWTIYNAPHMFSELKRAWAFWVLSTQGFSGQISATWGYERSGSGCAKKLQSKKEALSEDLAIRMQNVQLECTDAIRIITSRDSAKAFFYCDPPYFNSDCGHYDGYTEDDFEALLKALEAISGKFLLSSYPSSVLDRYTQKNGWRTVKKEMTVSVSKGARRKVEALTANYPL